MTFLLKHLAFALLACSVSLPAAETVIVNAKNGTTPLSDDELRDLFLGKKSSWSDGSKVVVVTLKSGATHDALMKFLGKTVSQYSTSWKKLVFTGKGSMPEQVDTEDELVAFVARTPGAVGFVDAGKAKDGVKALSGK